VIVLYVVDHDSMTEPALRVIYSVFTAEIKLLWSRNRSTKQSYLFIALELVQSNENTAAIRVGSLTGTRHIFPLGWGMKLYSLVHLIDIRKGVCII